MAIHPSNQSSNLLSAAGFKMPDVVYVDEDHSVRPPAYNTVEKLIKSLQDNGPLVAVGKMGPGAYTEAPFQLKEKVGSHDIYGWKPNTSKDHARQIPVLLLEARQVEAKAYVYYVVAQDVTRDTTSLIRGFKPSQTDTKIYLMSYTNFLERSLVDLHPLCPHGNWLYSVEVNSLLDRGATEKKCKEIGQQIFDHYKTIGRGDSQFAQEAVVRICEAAKVLTADGVVRKTHIERAWDGIGDANWRWMH